MVEASIELKQIRLLVLSEERRPFRVMALLGNMGLFLVCWKLLFLESEAGGL